MSDSQLPYLNDLDPDMNYFDAHFNENHLFSTYDSVDEFAQNNHVQFSDQNFISVFHQNIRSFNKNLDSFLLNFDDNSLPDSFIFSETWQLPLKLPFRKKRTLWRIIYFC